MLVVGGGCCAVLRARRSRSRKIPVAMARGKHLFPFRTEQLSPSAPMVLGPQGPGRVGRRRFTSYRAPLLAGLDIVPASGRGAGGAADQRDDAVLRTCQHRSGPPRPARAPRGTVRVVRAGFDELVGSLE